MKKMIGILTILLSVVLITSCEKEKVITEQGLPTEIKVYISTHFPSSTITKVVKEKRESELYEVTLSNGFKLEFDKNNNIVDIDGNSKLPDSVIPTNVLSYVNSNYSTNFIIGWELQSGNQEVQLNNNLVLVFNTAGEFLRVED